MNNYEGYIHTQRGKQGPPSKKKEKDEKIRIFLKPLCPFQVTVVKREYKGLFLRK